MPNQFLLETCSKNVIINSHRFSPAGATTLLLDESGLGGPLGAWSISRKLRSAYAGSCIRVRESSGNTELDIGFNGDVLDTAAMLTHCGANNGFIVTIYDQSGNGEDITQATTTKQTKIVNAGATVTGSNSKPAAEADGTDVYSRSTSSFRFGNTGQFTMADTLTHTAKGPDNDGGTIAGCYTASTGWLWYVYTPDGSYPTYGDYWQANASGLISNDAATNGTYYIHQAWRDSTNEKLYQNATEIATRAKGTLTAGAASFYLFEYASASGQTFKGKFHELVIWGSALGSTELGTMRTNTNSFYAAY